MTILLRNCPRRGPLLLAAGLLLLLGGCTGEQPRSPPNILLIMADDLGVNDVASYGGDLTATPAIDSIAAGGIRFTRHYTDSTCSPSRAALLSGQYPARLGFMPNGRGLSPDLKTLPRALQQAGYSTHHVGKWHAGDSTVLARPEHQGFSTSLAATNQWFLAGKRNENGALIPARPTYYDPWLSRDGAREKQYPGHLNDILTERALEIVGAKSSQPWFVNLWYYAPHAPLQPASRFTGGKRVRDKQDAYYGLLVQQMDENIGKLLQALQASGQLDNTIVVFLSDNGGTANSAASNFPLTGAKSSFMEGGVRTPMMMMGPGVPADGSVRTGVVSIMDLMPTLLDMLGLAAPDDIDGISLQNQIKDNVEVPERPLFWESYAGSRHQFGMLSEDGTSRFWQPPGVYQQVDSRPVNYYVIGQDSSVAATAAPQQLTLFRAAHKRWHREVHRVPVMANANQTGWQLTGADFLRSPGFGGYTLAFALDFDLVQPQADSVIAQHRDFWRLAYTAADKQLQLQFMQHEAVGGVVPQDGCNSLILTGEFSRTFSHWSKQPDSSKITVYWNAEPVIKIDADTLLDNPDVLHLATWVGSGVGGANPIAADIGKPLVLNVMTADNQPFTPDAVHRELCQPTGVTN